MRFLCLAAAIAIGAAGPALAQGAASGAPQAPDPAQSKQVDDAYRAECSSKAPKELCECLIGVADAQIADPAERQVFFAYSTGDVDKARTVRANFDVQKNMKFNVTLQSAETAVHSQCDKLRPANPTPPAASPKPTAQ